MSKLLRRSVRKRGDVPTPAERSKSEQHLIKLMEQKGGKGFRVLRSAETGMKRYKRSQPSPAVSATARGN